MSDCLHCDNWGCKRCQPQPDQGEQGLTVEEKELIKVRNAARSARKALEAIVDPIGFTQRNGRPDQHQADWLIKLINDARTELESAGVHA